MRNTIRLMLVFVLLVLCLGSAVYAESIWAKRTKYAQDRSSDDVARKIGDILTISIYESSNVSNTADRKMNKKTARNQNFDGNVGIEHLITSIPAVEFGTGTDYENSFLSGTSNTDKRLFNDDLTVVVVDIMPNGNLVVNGICSRNISDDIQTVEVSGIVRPSDVRFDNTVDSKRVANLSIITKYKGVSASYNKPGWLGSIMDTLWPF